MQTISKKNSVDKKVKRLSNPNTTDNKMHKIVNDYEIQTSYVNLVKKDLILINMKTMTR